MPSNRQLRDILSREFSGTYTYSMFGVRYDDSIIVGKSSFVGVQISKTNHEFMIQATPPTVIGGITSFLLSICGMGYFPSELKKLEQEVAAFLRRKFN